MASRFLKKVSQFVTFAAFAGAVTAISVGLGVLSTANSPAWAETARDNPLSMKAMVLSEGETEYTLHCQACHGPRGEGDGRMAKMLLRPPTDLSRIAARHDGRFPFWRTYEIIAGDVAVPGHETFQMPDFWKRFRSEEGQPGYAPAHLRILALTAFIENLQAKEK